MRHRSEASDGSAGSWSPRSCHVIHSICLCVCYVTFSNGPKVSIEEKAKHGLQEQIRQKQAASANSCPDARASSSRSLREVLVKEDLSLSSASSPFLRRPIHCNVASYFFPAGEARTIINLDSSPGCIPQSQMRFCVRAFICPHVCPMVRSPRS